MTEQEEKELIEIEKKLKEIRDKLEKDLRELEKADSLPPWLYPKK